MKTNNCPYCKEEIKADAIICKHCHSRIKISVQEMAMKKIFERTKAPGIAVPNVSECGAFCIGKFSDDKVALNECMNNCKEAEAVAVVAERMQRELFESFMEAIWSKGNIDPVPFEKYVRERFFKINKIN